MRRSSHVHVLKHPPQSVLDLAPLERRPDSESSGHASCTSVEEPDVTDPKLADECVDVLLELIGRLPLQQLLPALGHEFTPRLQIPVWIEELLFNQADNTPQDLLSIVPVESQLHGQPSVELQGRKRIAQ